MINIIKQKGKFYNQLLLKWLLGERLLFRYGVHILFDDQMIGNINLFYNEFSFLKEKNNWKNYLRKNYWKNIVDLMLHRYNLKSLGPSLFKRITKFRQSPTEYINNKAQHFQKIVESKSSIYFEKLNTVAIKNYKNNYVIEKNIIKPNTPDII